MSSVSQIAHDETFPQDALTAQDRVDSAKLQTQVGDIKNKVNEIIDSLDAFTRDDNTIADQHIRTRMLHPELIALLAASEAWQVKLPVSAVATSNYNTSGPNNIDGVTLTDDMRVLLTAQTDATENGIWSVNTGGAWTRTTDADADGDLDLAYVSATGGAIEKGSAWLCISTATVIGTTETEWAVVFSGQDLAIGSGLVLSGGVTLQVDTDNVTIELDPLGPVKVKDGGIGNTQLAANAVENDNVAAGTLNLDRLDDIPAATLVGSVAGGTPEALDANTDVLGMLPTAVGDSGAGGTQGLVPAAPPGSAAANHFYAADGTFKATPGGSGVNIQAFKDPCRMATTGNVALTGVQTIDGVVGVANDRVLVRAQTAAAENGIYVMAAGAWARATDADTAIELVPGTIVHVNEGTSYAGTIWRFTGSGSYTIGVTAIGVKSLNLATYGELSGTAVTITSALGKLSTGVTATGFGLLSGASAKLTVSPGGSGVYLISLHLHAVEQGAGDNKYLEKAAIYKNGVLLWDLNGYVIDVTADALADGFVTVTRAVRLTDGDYIEVYGETYTGGTNTSGNLLLTMNKIGD